ALPLSVPALAPPRRAPRLQLHHVPRGGRLRHRAARRVPRRPVDHPPAPGAAREPGGARGHAGHARRQGVHADDGRPHHPRGDRRPDAPLGQARQPVRPPRHARDGLDGRDRRAGRLPEAQAEARGQGQHGARRALQAHRPGHGGPPARLVPLGVPRLHPPRRVDDGALLQVRARGPAAPLRPRGRGGCLHPVRHLRAHRREQRGEPHRRPRRAGGRAQRHRRRDLRPLRVPHRPLRHQQLPAALLPPRVGRAHDLLRGRLRGVHRVSLVQRAPRQGVHGRHRLAGARRRAGRGRHPAQERVPAPDHRRGVRRGDGERDRAAVGVQGPHAPLRPRVRAEAPRVPPRPAPPPLRAQGVAGDAGGRALLDPRHLRGHHRPLHAQAPM
ncbi:MAG: Phospho-N-acetylmuramoyl-pentapeptide-transferase, partial [uncultured Gemmatimonadaceae bacterium]